MRSTLKTSADPSWRTFRRIEFPSCKVNPHSGILKILAAEIRNPRLWRSGIQPNEFGIQLLTIGIQSASSPDKKSGIQYLESTIQDCFAQWGSVPCGQSSRRSSKINGCKDEQCSEIRYVGIKSVSRYRWLSCIQSFRIHKASGF